mmetsp:Transcript_48365/g.149405  ORF Transcript_48365/g.149405 Transcript_48365/m.149405 type:complete len:591 (+) Transcript_48365:65-1837(+)
MEESNTQAGPLRIRDASLLWTCCCCGGLPLLGLLKALIFGPWPVLILCGGCTLISLSCLVHDAFLAYHTVWTSSLLGRNIRIVALLLLPVLLVLWPVVVLLLTLLGGLFYFFAVIAGSVFDENVPLLGGWWAPISDAMRWVLLWWRHNCKGAFDLAAHIRGIPRGWDGEVYDIPLANLFCSIGLIVWGSAVGSIGVLALATLKLLPALLRTLHEYTLLLRDLKPWWWLFWFCGLFLVIVACPLVYGLIVCYGFASGPRCAIEAVASASIVSGFLEVVRILREFDLGTNMFILHREKSCVPRVRERPSHQHLSEVFVTRPEEPLTEVWDRFFEECEQTVQHALAADWMLAASLSELDPAMIIGVPALCAFDVLHRSEMQAPNVQCICWSSTVCEEKTLPRNSIAAKFWPKVMACKSEIAKHLPLEDDDLLYLRVKICAGGGEVDALGTAAQAVLADERPRRQELHALCAEFTRLSLELSRLGAMQRRLPLMLAAVGDTPASAAGSPPAAGQGSVITLPEAPPLQSPPPAQVLGHARAAGLDRPDFQDFVAAVSHAAAMEPPTGSQTAGPGARPAHSCNDVDLPGFIRSHSP